MQKLNFTAGPSIIDPNVMQTVLDSIAQKEGLSILEISHRGPEIAHLFEETKALMKDLMQLDDRYEVLFLHGGARLQNCMIPYNICVGESANYLDTGIWAHDSYIDSCVIRETHLLASSREDKYTYIPKDYTWKGKGYLHLTTNNTVHGTQFFDFPKNNEGVLIADMSSDILSRHIDYNQFGITYAGLQKNLGTAGGCVVVIDRNLVKDLPNVPGMLNYKKHVDADSILNTPPIFAILFCNIVLKWIAAEGGVEVMDKRNREKASLLYNEIDRNELLSGFCAKEDRSLMNVSFKLNDESLTKAFEAHLEKNGVVGLNGHRSKGGYRASMYNMMPVSHVESLVKCLEKFQG